ncbi:16S rRNA (guanine(527)-N(7))-methyltransferase RsmG [Candidatus Poriferisocius sp.]|uniref:16S rRNA (guanine(527)-N(7))-methyltransferase RsmG n=1 Tax=Candidatus Poriferisocius sp. TaxID=3101276 RepID=UPI003B01FC61
MPLDGADRTRLIAVLDQAQERGWVGPQAINRQIDHSLAFAVAAAAIPTKAVDLGSGGGLPALVLAAAWPQSNWTLVESSLPRAAFLELHCARLGWSERVAVVHASAESLGQGKLHLAQADLVTARSFGPPPSVIEAAAPLLRLGGELIVSAAPNATPWPSDLLSDHGLSPDNLTLTSPKFHRTTRTSDVSRGTLSGGA